MRRYVSIPFDEEFVHRWEIGFHMLGVLLEYEMGLHQRDEWPDLAHVKREPYGWLLIFAWPEQ
jgi:hypothetical protein